MQTFMVDQDIKKTAQILDNRRLGKQRIEAIQIARTLLGLSESWKNHPAVQMWKNYEPFLIKIYLKEILDEWERRGFKNTKCRNHYLYLFDLVKDKETIVPEWLSEKFFISHQSNLVRKNREYYRKFFPNVQDDLEYVWPI